MVARMRPASGAAVLRSSRIRSVCSNNRSTSGRSNCPTSTTCRTVTLTPRFADPIPLEAKYSGVVWSESREEEIGSLAIEELASRVAMIPGGVNVGVLRGDGGRCVLIDTGLNDTSGKKAIKAVREDLGGEVVAILTTHAHADYFGANATVVQRTGPKVYP